MRRDHGHARTLNPPVHLRSCTVCCCRACLEMRPNSMATSPDGTRAPSRLCLYVPSHLPSYVSPGGRRAPRIPNLFDSLRLSSPRIPPRPEGIMRVLSFCSCGGSRGHELARPLRPCASAHTVCCCSICFMVPTPSPQTSPLGTQAPSRICLYVPMASHIRPTPRTPSFCDSLCLESAHRY